MRDYLVAAPGAGDAYALHRRVFETVAAMYGGGEFDRRFLYCPIEVDGRDAVLLRLPDPPAALETSGRAVERPAVGGARRFTLRALPQVKRNGRRGSISLWSQKDGLRRLWLERQSRECGFELLSPPAMESRHVEVPRGRKPEGKDFGINVTTYFGSLRVTDSDRFASALGAGVGQGRSWGCGLLQIHSDDGGASEHD